MTTTAPTGSGTRDDPWILSVGTLTRFAYPAGTAIC